MAPKRPADNNTQKNQPQQATLNKNIPQQPKVTTNNKNNQKLTQNIEKYPGNPEMYQNSYKKALGGPQSAQKVPRPSQNLPKNFPKPSQNPPQTLPKPLPNPSKIAILSCDPPWSNATAKFSGDSLLIKCCTTWAGLAPYHQSSSQFWGCPSRSAKSKSCQ